MNKILIPIVLGIFSNLIFAKATLHNTANIKCELSSNQKLVIGCTNYCGRWNRWALRRYARKLGYNIDIINLRSNKQTIDYTQVDGILIPGGSDINPEIYISQVPSEFAEYLNSVKHLYNASKIGEIRDEFEFSLLKDYFANEESRYQPILGICRGMQVLTVSQGIPLYLDIKTELGIKNRRYTLDRVNVQNSESLIQEIAGRSSFRGVKLHHQGLRLDYFLENQDKWPHLDVTATSNGGRIAEVLEFYDRPILGVQYHPEWTLFSSMRKGVYDWFLKRSCFNKVMGKRIFSERKLTAKGKF
ncbi:MAG: gamma-glutamyl-gamma-aminobutyrate hydrolase family protein [Bdellovibrionota bacterium]|nr:gamma-glutamyl-gamma-aminobutyrate hydrolase family protein [Bdellovibrionota bacterium]